MKILQICNKPPFPAVDGGTIAMGNMTRSMMMNGYDVTVLNMVSYKHRATEYDWPDELRKKVKLHFANVELRLKPLRALFNLFSSRSYHAERFYSEDVAQKLIAMLQQEKFDVIQMETVFPFVYHDTIRQHSGAKIILRLHNIEHEVWQSTAKAEKNPLKKRYLLLLARRLQKFEQEAFKKADAIITISSADLEKVKEIKITAPITNIPLGIDLLQYPASFSTANDTSISLFHLGAMDWIPNQQGISWFLETAWKKLHEQFPQLHFYIAGRKMPKKFFEMHDARLHVEGTVESPVQFMQSKNIMVAPLLSGSGIRVKIIEGMALGKTVVTTSLGAAGIDYKDGEHLLIANTPQEFVKKISDCVNDKLIVERIGRNARRLAEEKYSTAVTSNQFEDFLLLLR